MEITFEKFQEKYKPIQNPFTKEGSYENTLFETYGKDLEFVRQQKSENIWTLIDCENEESWTIPGYHIVNRAGYFITEHSWKFQDIEVNNNVMITLGKAKYSCMDFLESIGIELTDEQEQDLHNFWSQIV